MEHNLNGKEGDGVTEGIVMLAIVGFLVYLVLSISLKEFGITPHYPESWSYWDRFIFSFPDYVFGNFMGVYLWGKK